MLIFFVLLVAVPIAVVLAERVLMALAKRPDSQWRDALSSRWMVWSTLAVLVPLALLVTYAAINEMVWTLSDGIGGTVAVVPVLAIGAWVIIWRVLRASMATDDAPIAPPADAMLFSRIFIALIALSMLTASLGNLIACLPPPIGSIVAQYRAQAFRDAFEAYEMSGRFMGTFLVYGVLTACIVFAIVRVVFAFDKTTRRVRIMAFQPYKGLMLVLLTFFAPALMWTLLTMPAIGLPKWRIDWHHLVTPFQETINIAFSLCLFFLLLREAEIILQSRMRGRSTPDTTEAPAAALGA